MGFTNEDKIRTYQPHDDALVVTLHIKGYDVKRVLVYQGSRAEIMYPDLYERPNLKSEDLSKFDGRIVTPNGMIRLPMQTGAEVVEVEFIMVDAYSPYTAI